MSETTDTALYWHLRYNHYPAISDEVIGTCQEAIEAVNDSEPNRMISYNNQEAQAWAIVEALHLEDFLVISGQTSEGADQASR